MIVVERAASPALLKRVASIQAALGASSLQRTKMRADLKTIVFEDHADMVLRGVDRYGRPRAPLAPSTLKNRKRGPGPSLAPRGRNSRFVTNFVTFYEARENGETLVGQYEDILSKQGKPFARYHLTGATKPGTNWVLPRRDVGGVTPKGWAAVKKRFERFAADVAAAGKGSA